MKNASRKTGKSEEKMAALKNLEPDQILYKVRKEKSYHNRQFVDRIRIVSVDIENKFAVVKYNGGEGKYHEWQLKSWRVKEPQVKRRDIHGNPRY
jgi:hypothetical protein